MSNIAVLKVPDDSVDSMRELAQEIGEAIGGICFVLPHDMDIKLHEMAKEEIEYIHSLIHDHTEVGK